MYFVLIRLGIPQSALAFIFIGRGSRTPLQVGLYKNFQNKMKPTRITTGQTGLTGRPLNCQNWLSTHCWNYILSDRYQVWRARNHGWTSLSVSHKIQLVSDFVHKD